MSSKVLCMCYIEISSHDCDKETEFRNKYMCAKHKNKCEICYIYDLGDDTPDMTPTEIEEARKTDINVCHRHKCECSKPWNYIILCNNCQSVPICKNCKYGWGKEEAVCEQCYNKSN